MSVAEEQEPILASDLALRRRTLWLGKMELYEDHLSISGWQWTGTMYRPLPIRQIRLVEKWLVPRGVNFVIRPEEGRDYYCRLAGGVFFWVKELREDERTSLKIRP